MIRYSTQTDHTGKKIPLHDEEGLEGMRRAGRLATETLDHIEEYVIAGTTTGSLDKKCEEFMRDGGGIPATIGYHGYKHASCISVNHVVTHGIPSDDKRLRQGDILNIDVSPLLDGWHGDNSRMFIVGSASVKARRLVQTTYDAMIAGIATIKPGSTLGTLGNAIEKVGRARGLSTVREYCGHGIGRVFHDAPQILHYGVPGEGIVLEPGMFFTVEPMFNLGRAQVRQLNDGWTVVTRDRSWSAQFEHTVAVTEDGCEVLTLSPRGLFHPFVDDSTLATA